MQWKTISLNLHLSLIIFSRRPFLIVRICFTAGFAQTNDGLKMYNMEANASSLSQKSPIELINHASLPLSASLIKGAWWNDTALPFMPTTQSLRRSHALSCMSAGPGVSAWLIHYLYKPRQQTVSVKWLSGNWSTKLIPAHSSNGQCGLCWLLTSDAREDKHCEPDQNVSADNHWQYWTSTWARQQPITQTNHL